MPPRPGLAGSADLIVGEADTAISHQSGDVAVLATPRVLALCEEASLRAVENDVEPSETTVGMQVHIEHLQPTAVGHRVTAEAKVIDVKGRRITFNVSARDDRGLIAAGRVTRVIVERERFMEKAG